MNLSYEIMVQRQGKWSSESIATDKADAISRAEESLARGRVDAVRVIEETFDENTGDSREKVVFKRLKKDPSKIKRLKKKSRNDDDDHHGGRKRKPRRSLSDLLIIIVLGVISIVSSIGLVICVISR